MSVGGLPERIIHWLKLLLNVLVPIYHNPESHFGFVPTDQKYKLLTLSPDGWAMAHPCCSYSEALESWEKTKQQYCPSNRIDTSLEKKTVQLPCMLTAGKARTFSGAEFNVSNRGNEFMLVTKTDLNLQLSLSITLNFSYATAVSDSNGK